MNDFWSYWYFHIPNFVLAALAYTMIGRLVLGLFVPRDWDNYIWRFFRLLTDPVIDAVRVITPSVFTTPVVAIFALVWLMALRFVFLATLINLGLGPGVAQGG